MHRPARWAVARFFERGDVSTITATDDWIPFMLTGYFLSSNTALEIDRARSFVGIVYMEGDTFDNTVGGTLRLGKTVEPVGSR